MRKIALLALVAAQVSLTASASACACGQLPEFVTGIPAFLTDDKVQPTKADKDAERHRNDLKKDAELGAKYAAEALKELKPTKRAGLLERVQRIGNRLAEIANAEAVQVTWGDKRLNPFQYHFYVVEGKEVNAFSLPGGHIFVFEGLIDFAESDDELAGVIAHEIAHASFRHIATLQREQEKLGAITFPLILLSLLLGGESGTSGVAAGQLYNQAMGSGWSVQAEKSADFGGLQYMLRSPYKPLGILTFMERLAFRERKSSRMDWGIYRTHPPSRERANDLVADLEEAGIAMSRSQVSTTLSLESYPNDDGTVSLKFAQVVIGKLANDPARIEGIRRRVNTFMDTVPRLFDLRLDRGQLLGRGQRLFSLTEADAKIVGKNVEDATTQIMDGMKRAVFELNYRVWDAN
ncbi:MAG: M48 family metalloprotease [Chthonomonas sp.]|nr:M48 family metalloprotease [Chthonomonas sp.]